MKPATSPAGLPEKRPLRDTGFLFIIAFNAAECALRSPESHPQRNDLSETATYGMVPCKAMSEFKFACPVCGQHITADAAASGSQLECPTCFQKIIVPQAPASADSKLILSATQVGKGRPRDTLAQSWSLHFPEAAKSAPIWGTLVLVALGAGITLFLLRGKSPKPPPAPVQKIARPKSLYQVPSNVTWGLDIANAALPGTPAAGRLLGDGFRCELATLTGGNLTLRQGPSWPPDLGLTVYLFAKAGEELSGKTVEVPHDRSPPLPKVTLRWKDDQHPKGATRNFNAGYALKVVFGDATNGRIPGTLYIALPDDAKSFVAGTFEAEIRKPPPPKAPKK